MRPIYLDHHATTPLDPRVLQAMMPYSTEDFGNPSSGWHEYGWRAEEALEHARRQVATRLGVDPEGVVFTSGATEANNLAILGLRPGHVVTCAIEHPSVLGPARRIGATIVGVDRVGRLDPSAVQAAIGPDTGLVSVQLANHEIGTIQPTRALRAICRGAGVPLHIDATQGMHLPDLRERLAGVDLVSLSGHKIGGPKGIGALYVRPGLRLVPLCDGGNQEGGRRPGTVHVAGAVGLGAACDLLEPIEPELRDRLWSRLSLLGGRLNGPPLGGTRLPHNLNVSFPLPAADLLARLPGLAVSTGAACSTARTWAPSAVLSALGLPEARIRGAVRFGLGRETTGEQIDEAAEQIAAALG